MKENGLSTSQIAQDIANALSCITIVSCVFLKIPQILFVRTMKVTTGISIGGLSMEVIGLSLMTLYNYTHGYKLLTYLEYPIILLQVYILLYYVLLYKRENKFKDLTEMGVIIYIVCIAMFVLGILPKNYLQYSVPVCTPLSGFAKVTYIYNIIKVGNADAVSLTTWILSFITNAARIYTVYVDSGDAMLMINFTISALLSSGVFLTAYTYQKISYHSKCRPYLGQTNNIHASSLRKNI